MAKRHLRLVTPATVNRTVTPKRLPNSKLRTREYLTEAEVERVMNDAGGAMVDEAHFNSRCDQLLFATMATVSLMMKLARFSDGSEVPGRYVAGPRASRVSFMAKKERDASRHWRLGA